MGKTLWEVKEELKQHFLGKHGVHGIGMSHAEGAIRLYVDSDTEIQKISVLNEIKQQASPFPVIVIKEERPVLR